MRVIGPFQVTEHDVYASSTLTQRDIGRWALIVQGCYQFFATFADATECKRYLNA